MNTARLTSLLVALHATSALAEKPPRPATAEDAEAFIKTVDADMRRLVVAQSQAEWAKQTNITPETEAAAAKAGEAAMNWITGAIKRAQWFEPLLAKRGALKPSVARQLRLLRIAGQPAPNDPEKAKKLAAIMTGMDAEYGKGKACDAAGKCRDLGELEDVLAQSRDPKAQLEAWRGWHDTVGKTIRPMYTEFVALANDGARGIGFKDVGEMWRSGYDMPAAAFEKTYQALWTKVQPLYKALHCYVRRKLSAHYGKETFPADGPMPAHLLGNMWAQDWGNLFPLLEPFPGKAKVDVSEALAKQAYSPKRMVELGEKFFTSLGMDRLPATFWERSMFSKPEGKEAVCHASAWDVTYSDDLRIKMCIKPTHNDLITIHHELGHIYYFHHYFKEPMLFQNGANDGFHEAIGDTLALSVTPAYLKQVGLLDAVPDDEGGVINQQLYVALDKIAFLPWGLLVDKWRWDVFSGRVAPEKFNARWWELRKEFQGVVPPGDRSAPELFDPGAKYHVPGNTPYARYFLAVILQFQFHEALCKVAGHAGPLHTCSIYGNAKAGATLSKMLAMGATQPWPEALAVATGGKRAMDAGSVLAYFAPLERWLKQQNRGQKCGW